MTTEYYRRHRIETDNWQLDFAILSATYGHWVHVCKDAPFNPSHDLWLPITNRGTYAHECVGGKVKSGVLFGWHLLAKDVQAAKKYKHKQSSVSVESMKCNMDKNWKASNKLEILITTGSEFLELIADDHLSL